MAGESTIVEFLTRLSEDPGFADLFYEDPEAARADTELPDEKWGVIMSGDLRRLQEEVFAEQSDAELALEFKPVKSWPRPVRRSG